jgi:hypothetical protein
MAEIDHLYNWRGNTGGVDCPLCPRKLCFDKEGVRTHLRSHTFRKEITKDIENELYFAIFRRERA